MMDGPKVTKIRTRLKELLKAFEAEGLCATLSGTARYNTTTVKFTLEITEAGPDGKVEPKEARLFREQAELFGLKPTDLHRYIMLGGKQYQIMGLNPKAQKNVVILKDKNNREVICPAGRVKMALDAEDRM